MRYGPSEVHPSVWERIYDLPDGFDLGVRMAEHEAHEAANLVTRKRALRSRLTSKPVLTAEASFVILAIAMIAMNWLPGLIAVGILFASAGLFLLFEYFSPREEEIYETLPYSATSLAVVIDHIQPDAMVQTYIKSLIAVGESQALADYDRRAAIAELNLLMDEYVRIEKVRRNLLRVRDSHSLGEEIEHISRQLMQTTDAATVESLEQSLAIAERRQKREQGSIALLKRIDAELMLLRQLLGQLRESVSAEQPVSVDFSEIRERLAAITSRTDETERAREELDRAL